MNTIKTRRSNIENNVSNKLLNNFSKKKYSMSEYFYFELLVENDTNSVKSYNLMAQYMYNMFRREFPLSTIYMLWERYLTNVNRKERHEWRSRNNK